MTWLRMVWSDLRYLRRRLDGLAAAYSGKDARAHQIDVALDTRDVYDHCTTCGCPQGCKALHRYPCDCEVGASRLEVAIVVAVLAVVAAGMVAGLLIADHMRCQRLQGDPRAAFYGCTHTPAEGMRRGDVPSAGLNVGIRGHLPWSSAADGSGLAAPDATGRSVVPRRPVAARASRSRAPLPAVLLRIRACESGDYREHHRPHGATGAWQITDETWNHFDGYARAYLAPAVVQDAKAVALYLDRGTEPWNASRGCWS